MDHVTAEEQNVVERYVLGQLDSDEATRFEQHYLDCSSCLEKLELAEILHDGLRGVAAEEGARVGAAALLWAWWRQLGRSAQAGLTFALVAIAVLPWALLVPRLLDGGGGPTLAPRAGTVALALSPERSAPDEAPSTVLTLRPEPEWVVLNLLLPSSQDLPEGADWRIHLLRDEHVVWSGPIQPDGSGHVVLSVHSSWLEPAIHRAELVQVDSEGTSRPVTNFAFEVRHQSAKTPAASASAGTRPAKFLEAQAMRKFRVNRFEGTPLSKETALHEGTIVGIGANDGWVTVTPGGQWDTYPTCKPFDYVGIARVKGPKRPEIWYSIQVKGDSLAGALYDGNPCDNSVPSAIASWEADEETWESEEELMEFIEALMRAREEARETGE